MINNPMEQQKEYYAFISYKREDEKWAKWLQDKLDHYKFPTNLNGRTDLPKPDGTKIVSDYSSHDGLSRDGIEVWDLAHLGVIIEKHTSVLETEYYL